ncbi:MAG: phosphate ABC transporter substrate-binding protein [Telluria sp.]
MIHKLALAATLLASLHAGARDLVVVVSTRSPVTSMRAEQVADIFLGQVGHFPDGTEAVALDQPVGSPLRDEFYARVAARTPPLMKAYWTKMIFTGRGQPPREAPNSATVRRMVAENPALIGYIDRSALDPTVRPVLVVH